MHESLRLGTIAGVRVGLNISVLAVLVILVAGLATGLFPAAFPGLPVSAYIIAALAGAVLFLSSLLAHEVAHAVVAQRHGIRVEGIVLWMFGGVAHLRGEPRTPGADFRIAAVGPLTSLIFAAISGGVAALLAAAGMPGLAVGVFGYLAAVNVMLAVFNLLPAAPLDGGRILRAALWHRHGDRIRAATTSARAGRVFGYVLAGLGVVQVVAGLGFDGLWLVLIALILINAATAEERQAGLSENLRGVKVEEVMSPDPVVADPNETLERFVAETVWTRHHSSYPLLDTDGRLTGLVTLNRIRAVPPERRSQLRLRDIACPPDNVPTATADEQVLHLLPRMADHKDGRAVVVDNTGQVIGIVSPSDLSRFIQRSDLRRLDPDYAASGADISVLTGTRS